MLAWAPAVILAWTAAAPCEDARKQYEALSPEGALDLAESTLLAEPSRPLPCLEIRALSLLVLGRREAARQAFGELFQRDPERVIVDPSLPPTLIALIEGARTAVRPLRTEVRSSWISAGSLRLEFAVDGGLRGARAVRWMIAGGTLRTEGTAKLVGRVATATVAVPLSVELGALDVSGTVVDERTRTVGRVEAHVMLTGRPLPPPPPPEEQTHWQWVLWGGLIAAAAAATTVSVVVLAQPRLPDTSGSIGRVDVGP